MATTETKRSKMTPDNKSNEVHKKQQDTNVARWFSQAVAKRKLEATFDLPIRKPRKPHKAHHSRSSVPSPSSTPISSKEPYWHAAGISRNELMPKFSHRTYLYLNEGDYTVATKQMEELRSMFQKYVGKQGNIKADRWGYYILFEDSKHVLENARKCLEEFRFQRFEDALMPMMLFHKGECVARCHLNKDEFDEEGFVWVGDALLKSLG
jgi:hypothetical protein